MSNSKIYFCLSVILFFIYFDLSAQTYSCCQQVSEGCPEECCRRDQNCCVDCYFEWADSPFYRYRILNDKTSQSFMFFHPAFQQISLRQSLWHNFAYQKPQDQKYAMQVIALYEESIDSKRVANYFLPFQKCNDTRILHFQRFHPVIE